MAVNDEGDGERDDNSDHHVACLHILVRTVPVQTDKSYLFFLGGKTMNIFFFRLKCFNKNMFPVFIHSDNESKTGKLKSKGNQN